MDHRYYVHRDLSGLGEPGERNGPILSQIVDWSVREQMTKEPVLEAFDQACEWQKPPPGLIHHSDRGSRMLLRNIVSG
ncbi:hypothetical protein [Paenibacillus harenae]|uniref:hypothetical protein n=1 Tax=Paenibacillus harenae TaxID=306543 RepID=UPI0027D7C377|nr:hypothetical protein [Paenibacillus harenae]